jgi:hypothetical protein
MVTRIKIKTMPNHVPMVRDQNTQFKNSGQNRTGLDKTKTKEIETITTRIIRTNPFCVVCVALHTTPQTKAKRWKKPKIYFETTKSHK